MLGNGFWRTGFVLVEDGQLVHAKRMVENSVSRIIRVVCGFGEPWNVEQEQVRVFPSPDDTEAPLGILCRGDIAGGKRREGNWLELTQDSEVRIQAPGAAESTGRLGGISAAREVRELKEAWGSQEGDDMARAMGAKPNRGFYEVVRAEAGREAWVMVESTSLGQLLRRCERLPGSMSDCVVGRERLMLYREVIQLCHRRIYSENLESLWAGDHQRLPTPESLEAKLLDVDAKVLHVANGGRICGGAIIREVAVRAKQLQGAGDVRPTRATVCYIDMCAAEPGSHAGSAVWAVLSQGAYACITCHPIMLQDTVDFWQSRGMRRFDPSDEKDCETFSKQVLTHTGTLCCELTDVQEALPNSKLPLFVFISTRFIRQKVKLSEYA